MNFQDHFSGHAGDYARFRPGYPETLFAWIAHQSPGARLAWDCGCGSGQATVGLARYFERVVASDASRQQLASAPQLANVNYLVANASHSGLRAQTVDTVCVAQALHWFDLPGFFTECRRVAAPRCLLCVWTYGSVAVSGIDDSLFHEFERQTLKDYWPAERSRVDRAYADVVLPGTMINPPDFEMIEHWNLQQLLGYIASWSAVRRARAATGHDPLTGLVSRLASIWGDPASERPITWPLTVVAAHL